jgi:pimeloyl-ACP methyl ester carboxylesterase
MGYQLPAYVADMVTLLARLNAQTLHWVGTSMGGLIGLGLASLPKSPISRLVLNDVGPTIQPEAIARIGSYLGLPMRWATVQEAADYMLSISKGFGTHSREQWLRLTEPMLKADGGGFKPHYDPNIALPFRAMTPEMAAAGEAALWRSYDAVTCPTLLLRGADSDLLTRDTATAMTQRGPKAKLHEFADVGHAPMLVVPEQVNVVREFLLGP